MGGPEFLLNVKNFRSDIKRDATNFIYKPWLTL